ncbi:hypothetical protein JKP88DRAFT_169835 [Tribonema minus]|uniref:Transformation/transcription domain-associated protein n=1 Tax=Tribonema minus TaxID=303371 RepID=A0A835YM43_9STRA|nr:hypothetical protein JKP88DRAFT_169835 [Tribonema minus]
MWCCAVAQVVVELRERIEIVHTPEFLLWLQYLFPVFEQLLRQRLPPQMVDNQFNKIRAVLWDILNRLPHSETLQPYALQLLKLCMDMLKLENEDNAVICVRTVFDLHKARNFRPLLEPEVQPFLDLVLLFYRNLKASVAKVFGAEGIRQATAAAATAAAARAAAATPLAAAAEPMPLLPCTDSFKVLVECPIIVMLLFQLYHKYVPQYIPEMIPIMISALGLQPPGGVPSNPVLMGRFKELLAAQVKTLSFLTYLLKSFGDTFRQQQRAMSNHIMSLLRRMPPDAIMVRKDLLTASRHIFATEFRQGERRVALLMWMPLGLHVSDVWR